LGALARCADKNLQLLADLALPDVLVEQSRPQRPFDHFFIGRGGRCRQHLACRRGRKIVSLDGHNALASGAAVIGMPDYTARPWRTRSDSSLHRFVPMMAHGLF